MQTVVFSASTTAVVLASPNVAVDYFEIMPLDIFFSIIDNLFLVGKYHLSNAYDDVFSLCSIKNRNINKLMKLYIHNFWFKYTRYFFDFKFGFSNIKLNDVPCGYESAISILKLEDEDEGRTPIYTCFPNSENNALYLPVEYLCRSLFFDFNSIGKRFLSFLLSSPDFNEWIEKNKEQVLVLSKTDCSHKYDLFLRIFFTKKQYDEYCREKENTNTVPSVPSDPSDPCYLSDLNLCNLFDKSESESETHEEDIESLTSDLFDDIHFHYDESENDP